MKQTIQAETSPLRTLSGGGSDLSSLQLSRLCFVLRSRGIEWTQFKGFTFHGAMGNALKTLDLPAYQALYEASGVGAPFVLTPPLDHQRSYPPGHDFLIEITLFGKSISHMPACCKALQEVGQRGIDKFRGKFDVIEVLSVTPGGTLPVDSYDQSALIHAGEIAAAACEKEAQQVELRFLTPVRIKKNNVLLRENPSFSELMEKLMSRASLLGGVVGREERAELLAAASRVKTARSDVKWKDKGYERYSARQNGTMIFGGLLGASVYQGNLTPFLPYLLLLEYINLGGKTTFGLGKCAVTWEK